MSAIKIRPAIPADARAIQEVVVRTWRETYPNADEGITSQDIEAYFGDPFSPETLLAWEQEIAAINGRYALLAAEVDDQVVGVCRAFVRPESNQVQLIYVLPEFQGRGIGRSFFSELEGYFDPHKDVVVQVVEYNASAIAFYERLGFKDTGKRL
jgi:ribosomal protein S18 acetylase RimI-like enzyme